MILGNMTGGSPRALSHFGRFQGFAGGLGAMRSDADSTGYPGGADTGQGSSGDTSGTTGTSTGGLTDAMETTQNRAAGIQGALEEATQLLKAVQDLLDSYVQDHAKKQAAWASYVDLMQNGYPRAFIENDFDTHGVSARINLEQRYGAMATWGVYGSTFPFVPPYVEPFKKDLLAWAGASIDYVNAEQALLAKRTELEPQRAAYTRQLNDLKAAAAQLAANAAEQRRLATDLANETKRANQEHQNAVDAASAAVVQAKKDADALTALAKKLAGEAAKDRSDFDKQLAAQQAAEKAQDAIQNAELAQARADLAKANAARQNQVTAQVNANTVNADNAVRAAATTVAIANDPKGKSKMILFGLAAAGALALLLSKR